MEKEEDSPPPVTPVEVQIRKSTSHRNPKSRSAEDGGKAGAVKDVETDTSLGGNRRSPIVWLTLFSVILYSSLTVYQYQYESMPMPLNADQAGKRGFSEVEAMKHVKALTAFGPRPLASDALDGAVQYVLAAAEKIKSAAHWEVDVQVDFFNAHSEANRLSGGLFKGKTLVYSDLQHVVLRILPKYMAEAGESAILVSSHIDTVFSTEGAGDCSSCIAVMMELARAVSQWAHGFRNAVVFLFNTGEEEGLNGAHSFITQHPWSSTIRMAVDLEAMGIGGKSGIFQTGPNPYALEVFAAVAKYPSGNVIAQDLFAAGAIKSATDFQVYKEIANLSGLDFAYTDNNAVYHTKNDKLELLKAGSLQHLGENMLSFLLQIASSDDLSGTKAMNDANSDSSSSIFFDILGMYMVLYRQSFAKMLHNSVIMQALLIWATSLFMGGYPAVVSLALSCVSLILMWIFSLSFSALAALVLSLTAYSPVPYVASPWLVVGLFGAPSLLGAMTGQHLGFLILQTYLSSVHSKQKQLSNVTRANLVRLEAERWLYKAGFIQWLTLLALGNYYKFGSSFLALFWLLPPAFSYGLLEATLTPIRFPKPLKLATLLLGLSAPILVSAGVIIRLCGTLVGMVVRFGRNPGDAPEWLATVIISAYVAAVVCLTMVYILSYVHLSGAKKSFVLATLLLFGLSLAAVLSGVAPPFTEDTARAVNVVHVVDATSSDHQEPPSSYISLFSTTPGKLTKEAEQIKGGFVCGRDKVIDLVSFSVKYGCLTYDDTEDGWSESDVPTLTVLGNNNIQGEDRRITRVSIDTKGSLRWVLAINTQQIQDFKLEGDEEELVPLDEKTGVDGWHTIQFSGGKRSPTLFDLTLVWHSSTQQDEAKDPNPLLKLRTDLDRTTPKTEEVLMKLPSWCSLFGKSTSPYTLSFLKNLAILDA